MNLDQKNIIIFESKYQLERYKASNPSFFEDLEVLTDLEILPYDNFSPDPSLLGKRIETLRSLIEDEVSLACTSQICYTFDCRLEILEACYDSAR